MATNLTFKRFLLELEHLHDVTSKKGSDFLEKLLNDTIVVNIKIDQSAFVIKKYNGKVTFHGREGKSEITKTKRAIIDIYEDAINHLEQRAKRLPDNIEVYLELFHEKLKTKVHYKTKPKNNLIISYIKVNGKTILPDDLYNQQIADILEVSPPPVLFKGKLTEKQKNAIKDFVSINAEQRKQKYGETKFLDFIMSMFTTPSELKWLQEGGYEGVVFYFKDSQYTAKIVDPMFTAEKQEESQESLDEFREKLLEFIHKHIKNELEDVAERFVKSPNIQSTDDVFIEFVSVLTRHFIEKHHKELSNLLDRYEHEQKSRRFTNLTYSLLPRFVKQLAEKYWWTEELFATLINMLQKEKSRINIKQGLTQERKQAINDMVARLRSKGLVK